MPCYLFTYHAYGTWLPDRKRGYVKRREGILPTDTREGARYRAAMKESAAEFDSRAQQALIDAIIESQARQSFLAHYVATDPTHGHVLVSWRDDREWLHVRSIVKGSISRFMKQECDERTWLSEGASRKRVKDRAHFDYLVMRYLPSHRGWKWCPERGKFL
jgi:hypothetical protein